jgi:NAD(P)-dependent dehydrogenase (short-subunit alcohol dehydrogenase family)
VTDDDERVAVVDEALRDWEGVDILVNNAGIAYRAVVSCTWIPATPSARARFLKAREQTESPAQQHLLDRKCAAQ